MYIYIYYKYICVCVRVPLVYCIYIYIICRFMSMCPFTCACVCQQRYQRCGPQPSRTVLYKDLRQLLRFSDCSITPRKLSKADWHLNKIKDKITPNKTPWCSVIGIEPFAGGVKSIHYFKILYKRSIKGDGIHDPALCCRFCRTSCTLICFQLAIWIYLAEPQAKRTTARSAVFSGLRPNSTARLWM